MRDSSFLHRYELAKMAKKGSPVNFRRVFRENVNSFKVIFYILYSFKDVIGKIF
jgi:hypothetical protein